MGEEGREHKFTFTKEEYDRLEDVAYDIIIKMIKDFSIMCGVIPDDDYILTPEWADEINLDKEKIYQFTSKHWLSNREMFAIYDFVKTSKGGIFKVEAIKIFLETITNKEWLAKKGLQRS